MLSLAEVASRMNVTVATIRNRIRDQYFHPIRSKGRLLIPPEQVDAEIERVAQLRTLPRRDFAGQKEDRRLAAQRRSTSPPRSDAKTSAPVACTGKVAAGVFSAFRGGKTPRDVVIDLEITPELAAGLWQSYVDLGREDWLLPANSLDRIRQFLGWEETPPTPEGFEQAMRTFLASEIQNAPRAALARISDAPAASGDAPLSDVEMKALVAMDSADDPEQGLAARLKPRPPGATSK